MTATAISPVRAFQATGALPGRGVTVLEASAGTGKTYSIATLVLRLVAEENVPLERILAVTFSVDAAAELRDRIRRRLVSARDAAIAVLRDGATPDVAAGKDRVVRHLLDQGPLLGDYVERLGTAVERFDDAAVFTIHAFCQRMLREQALECRVPLAAELDADVASLVDEVVRDFWVSRVAVLPADVVRCLDAAGAGFEQLVDVATKAVTARDARVEPEATDDGTAALLALQQEVAALRSVWAGERVAFRQALLDACEGKLLRGTKPTDVQRWCDELNAWLDGGHLTVGTQSLGRIAKLGARHLGTVEKDPRSLSGHPLATAIDALCERLRDPGFTAERAVACLKHACAHHARAEVQRRRAQRHTLGYDDLLHLLRDALVGTDGDALAAALGDRYDAVLLDEFQDTDAVQWGIFEAAFGKGGHRLVLIGDPKQSIYGFRGADVATYLHAAGAEDRTRLVLGRNFRSDGPYVAALNAAYGALSDSGRPTFAHAEIAYAAVEAQAPEARLLEGDGKPGAGLRIRVLPRAGRLDAGDPKKPIDKTPVRAVLPALVAADVVRFLRSGASLVEHGVKRPVSAGDVAVLVRRNSEARAIQQALWMANVPCVLRSATSVYGTPEAAELATVLAAVLDPDDGRAVRRAVATDLLGGAAASELGIAGTPGVGDALLALRHDEATWERWDARFRRWRALWRGRGDRARAWTVAPGIAATARAILEDLALPERILALVGGERRLTNVLHLVELLQGAAVREALGPEALLAWLRERIARADDGDAPDDAEQMRLESDADAAQIVTIHKSKGLEYPVVWCPYLWDGGGARGNQRSHPRYTDWSTGAPVRALDVAPVKPKEGDAESVARQDDEQYEEALRLAYVALTRARHRCTVWWGPIKDAGASPLAWLLHGHEAPVPPDADVRTIRTQMKGFLSERIDDEILRAAERLAERAPGSIAVTVEDPTPDPEFATWRPEPTGLPALLARTPLRPVAADRAWRLGSFTSLTARTHAPGAAAPTAPIPDADAELPESVADAAPILAEQQVPTDAEEVPLADLPRNVTIGICVHEILEHHDYTDADTLEDRTRAALVAYRFPATRWTAPLTASLRQVLESPLATPGAAPGEPPLRLSTVPPERRLTELRFELPVCGGFGARDGTGVTAARLAEAFAAHPGGLLEGATLSEYAESLRGLDFETFRGFLTGAIDLVVPHGARWWVADWKTNFLGRNVADYAPDRLLLAMTRAHYVLQYHLYLVALHRWLGVRLPRYDYDAHIAGAAYVFLRGVDGEGRGLVLDRPPRARIEALDHLFRTGTT